MSSLRILGIIVFFLCYGILLRKVTKKQRDVVLNISKAFLKCVMMGVVWVVWFTPIGMLV